MLLLRIAGEVSATHIQLLEMFADPEGVAARLGKGFEWRRDKFGGYPLKQVTEALDPELAADAPLTNTLFRDLERLGLIGGDDPMSRVVDGGGPSDPPPDEMTTLGRELLAFIASPADS
jgi:hypothetical protein